MTNYQIYTDGACSGNPGPGGWGVVILDMDLGKILRKDCGGSKSTTNNRMEIQAILEALILISKKPDNNNHHYDLFSDSQYVIKGITEWLDGWKRNGWKNASKQPVKNSDLWQILDCLLKHKNITGASITFHWIKGHAGHEYNEMADQLAHDGVPKETADGTEGA